MSTDIRNTAPTDARSVAIKLLECIGAQNLEAMRELFADEIEWFVPGSSDLPWPGRRTRGSEVPDFFAVMWPHFVPGKSSAEIGEIISDDTNVVIIGSFTHVIQDNAKSFTTPVAMHLKVDGEKIVHLQLYEDTLLVRQAFGSADVAPAVGRNDPPKSLRRGEDG